jgi:two-component system, OmpR family, KDP operon response regulator KdpE
MTESMIPGRARRYRCQASRTEFAVLQLLVSHSGKVLTYDQILREIWGNGKEIEHLRVDALKAREGPPQPALSGDESGVGYQLLTSD